MLRCCAAARPSSATSPRRSPRRSPEALALAIETSPGESLLELAGISRALCGVTLPRSDHARWFADEVLPHEAALRGYLHGLVAPVEVDDIVQETYSRLLRARERGPVDSPRGLLFATARNAARDFHRRRAVRNTLPIGEIDQSRVFDDAPDAAETASRRQEADLLTEAIASLPPRCREILLMRKFENLSHREIAQRLGIAEHTVGIQLTKALHRCEEFFVRRGALKTGNP